MSNSEESSLYYTPVGTIFTPAEKHEPLQEVQPPVSNTDANLLQERKCGFRMEERINSRKDDFMEEDRRNAWKIVDEAVKIYSDEMVQRWDSEMKTLLIYAGIFSAVLTPFIVMSYMMLSPHTQDPVLAAITQISAQLASFYKHDSFINSTQPAFQSSFVASSSTPPQTWAVSLNVLWFSSLICGLSTATITIMVMQWIREYNSGVSEASHHTAHLRQYRYNGLVRWKVPTIIAVLPILLQMASGLFMAGLLVLLWNLNHTVAIVASALVGALLAFTLVTIILPTFTSDCAYLSPLSTSLFRSCHLPYSKLRTFIHKNAYAVQNNAPSWSFLERISTWLSAVCEASHPPTVHAMQWAYVTSHEHKLDQDIFVTAYSKTGDMSLLEHASTCFSDHSIDDLSTVLTCIHAENMDYGQTAREGHWTHYIPLNMASDMLLVRPRNTSGVSGETSGQQTSALQDSAGRYLACSNVISGVGSISYMLSNMAAVLYNDGNGRPDGFPLYQCLAALRKQMNSIKGTKNAVTDDVRRHMIAAIFTVVRTSTSLDLMKHHDACLDILIFCSTPSISQSQLGDMVEEDARRKLLADVIALTEDALIVTLGCPGFREGDREYRCLIIEFFWVYCQHFDLEQLASRVSENLLRDLKDAVQNIHPGTVGKFGETWKHALLYWLQSLEKERDKHMAAEIAKRRGLCRVCHTHV